MRLMRIATVSFLLDDHPHSVAQNVARAVAYVRDAARAGADIVLLPESVTTINTAKQRSCVGENFPGTWTKAFSNAARTHNVNLIAPYFVQVGKKRFNQATVFRRDGSIAGFYRKVQPHAQELKHVTPGDAFPVIELDCGRIAVMICFDIYFPEIARIYAMNGAEVLFWPTMTVGPTQEGLHAQLVSRAIDNSLHVVESNYAQRLPYAPHAGRWRPGNARVINYDGETLASTGRKHGIAIAEIDLDVKRMTSQVVLRREPDRTREDIEWIARMPLFATEYARLARRKTGRS